MTRKSEWNECRVFEQLRHIFPSPAHVRIPAVRNGTGFSRAKTRTADGIIFSAWPSRGLWMAGIEIKVSRSDWKKELADPSKADEIAKYCDYWYVAAPFDVIPVNEVPKSWGLIQVNGNTAEITKQAEKREPVKPDIALVCAIFRQIEERVVPVDSIQDRVNAARAEAMQRHDETCRFKYELDNLKRVVDDFEGASGIKLHAGIWDAGKIGSAVKAIRECGGAGVAIERMRAEAERAKSVIDGILQKTAAAESELALKAE